MNRLGTRPVWRGLLLCLWGSMLFMAVAALNGYPLFFNDTRSYVRGPAMAFQALVKRNMAQDWPRSAPPVSASDLTSAPLTDAKPSIENNGITANRSIYYGFLAFLGYVCGNFWLTVFIQSFWLAGLIYIAIDLLADGNAWVYIASTSLLGFLSTAGFYTGYIMPDVFAPIMILATGMMLICDRTLTRLQFVTLTVSVAYAVLAHPSHPVILLCLIVTFFAWARLSHAKDIHLVRPIMALLACIAIGVAGQWVFREVMVHYTGQTPLLLPHIEAHLIDMGPGTDFVKHGCQEQQFAVCAYKDRFPMYWENFIGNPDPAKGVFAAADMDTKRRLSNEQIPFALAVFRYDPAGVTLGLAHDAIRQLVRFSLNDFIVDQLSMTNYETRFPAVIAGDIRASAVRQSPNFIKMVSVADTVFVILAFIVIVIVYRQYKSKLQNRRDTLRFTGFLLVAVLLNGLVCGILASPYDRFQARVIWLVVLAACLIVANVRLQSRSSALGPSARTDKDEPNVAVGQPSGWQEARGDAQI